jgi:8-oxo-dGTP diphosphatase
LRTISTDLSEISPDNISFSVAICRFRDSWVLVRVGGQQGWEFPGGKIDAGETPRQGILRELFEETGISRVDISPLGWYSVDRCGSLSYGYLYRCIAAEPPGPLPAGSEIAEAALHRDLPGGPYRFPLIIPGLFEFARSLTWQ